MTWIYIYDVWYKQEIGSKILNFKNLKCNTGFGNPK